MEVVWFHSYRSRDLGTHYSSTIPARRNGNREEKYPRSRLVALGLFRHLDASDLLSPRDKRWP